ncbi:hypothetical protein M7I_8001 [Glarea lozoyensis 74030]|uniref:Uncharacterized protein n=1 Tax=Glarea lozoyensis (strain ATCC 74030 / MF5533) TaxID=1104152 RepID=H0EYU1_GLAL7|nr:hypothetical protein M7I_8001 [Glarea lozoyensis 74030]
MLAEEKILTKVKLLSVWLKTDKNCYVTQYDLLLYNGTYETDLAYCGKASEVKKYTQTPAKAKYNTECWICPSISCDNVAYHKYGTNLVTTCYADEDPESAPYNGDSVWVKTTQNCYVSETGLVTKPDRSKLDNCGPIPFLQLNQTTKGTPQTSEPDEKRAPPNLDLDKRYLVDFLVGEDFAVCYKNYTTAAPVVKKYKWDTKVAAQCFEDENSYPETLSKPYTKLQPRQRKAKV